MNTNTITSTNPAATTNRVDTYYNKVEDALGVYNQNYDEIGKLAAKANALYNKGGEEFRVQSSVWRDDDGWELTVTCNANGSLNLYLTDMNMTREVEFDGQVHADEFVAHANGARFNAMDAAKAVQELFGSLMDGFFNELQECIERGDKVLPAHLKEMMGR